MTGERVRALVRPRPALVALGVAVVLVGASVAVFLRGPDHPDVIVGVTSSTTSTPPTEPSTILQPPSTLPPPDLGRAPLPEPGPAVGRQGANGPPFAPAAEFHSDTPNPADPVFILLPRSPPPP